MIRNLLVFAIVFQIATLPAGAASAPPPDPRASIRDIVGAARHPDLPGGAFADLRTTIQRLYENRDSQPLWLDGGRPSEAATMLVARLESADSLGLDPADYDAAALARMADGLKKRGREAATAEQLALYDIGLSVAASRFVSALACGRVDPVTIDPEYDIPRHCPPVDSIVAELRDEKRQGAVLQSVQPQFLSYQLLKNGLARYRVLARVPFVPLPEFPPNVRPGQSLPAAAELRHVLRSTGDLAKGKAPKPARDTVYTPELVAAVTRFQGRHGLLTDGILWSMTLDELRRPFSERVGQIERTLERWRWLPRTDDAQQLIVNIPAFRLDLFEVVRDRRESVLAMDVLVGAAGPNETPELTAPMTYLVFRPFWEIPGELAQFELGPRADWDRENMERLGYVLVRRSGSDATELPLTEANLARLGKDLRLRQRPGPLNALGLVKFMLPNEHDIYLHDTAVPGLFVMPRRDFSHGCVRVSEPAALAAHVLRGQPDWTLERVKAAMESGEDNVRVNLAASVPVLIMYATAAAAGSGEMQFFADIYERETKLDLALRVGPTSTRPTGPSASAEE